MNRKNFDLRSQLQSYRCYQTIASSWVCSRLLPLRPLGEVALEADTDPAKFSALFQQHCLSTPKANLSA